MNWLYEAILHKTNEGQIGGYENVGDPNPLDENECLKDRQCYTLNDCYWKDLLGREEIDYI